jgi:hypothetical protein
VFFGIGPRKAARPAQALKPRLVGDRDLAAHPPDQPAAGDVRRLAGSPSWTWRIYYARVGDWLLAGGAAPAGDVIRCPTGDLKDLFYQRHAFQACRRRRDHRARRRGGARRLHHHHRAKGYLGLTQFGAVEFHLWGCHIDDPEHPDRLVMDLDPDESLPWARVCDGAEILRDRLQALGFAPVPAHHRRQGPAPGRRRWTPATTGRR